MDTFNKKMSAEMLGKIVERKSGEGINTTPVNDETREFLRSMPESEFAKLVEIAKEEGDKETLAALLSNWPFKKE